MSGNAEGSLDLEEIQGNIIGFNKPCQRLLLLRFTDSDAARDWLTRVTAADVVTSGLEVAKFRFALHEAEQGRGAQPEEKPWLNLAFTHAGLQKLATSSLDGLFPGEFVEGMARRADILGDVEASAPPRWTFPAGGAEVHALLILAAADRDGLDDLENQWGAAQGIAVVGREDGQVLKNEDGKAIEHFGFRDGVSQPTIRDERLGDYDPPKPDQDRVWPGEFVLGYPRQNPTPEANDGLARLHADPPTPAWTLNGSYLVLRRLRQRVRAFRKSVHDEATALGLTPPLLEAKLVGRYRSGRPLVEFAPPGAGADPGLPPNDQSINRFTYEGDGDGKRVPRGAHIRRLNQRDQTPLGHAFAQTRRILRRGLPYGPRFRDDEAGQPIEGEPDRGLLFLCYQRSIAEQFEFLQRSWANDAYFPPPGTGNVRPGRDPFAVKGPDSRRFHIPVPDNDKGHATLKRWVIMTGGDYFFCPSKNTLGILAAGKIPDEDDRDRVELERGQVEAERGLEQAIAARRQRAREHEGRRIRVDPMPPPAGGQEAEDMLRDARAMEDNARRQLEEARRQQAEAADNLEEAADTRRRALGLDAEPRPIPPLPNTIRGAGDCKLQITVAFNGLDPHFYYPWRVWVGGEPVWASQRSDYLVPGSDGFATGIVWLRLQRLLEAFDPDRTAGEIVESRWRNDPPGEVLGAYLKWEVEVITRTEARGGGVKAIPRLIPGTGMVEPLHKDGASSVAGVPRAATVWAEERIGEFFPIDMAIGPP